MSNINSSSAINSSSNSVILTPEEAVELLRVLRGRVPEYVQLPTVVSSPLTRAATVSIEFVHAAINAIAASLALQNAIGQDPAELRLEAEMTVRWSQVLDEIEVLRRGVLGAIRTRRYRLGTTAFRTYQVSRNLALDDRNAVLRPHLDAMKSAAKFGKYRGKSKSEPEPLPLAKQP